MTRLVATGPWMLLTLAACAAEVGDVPPHDSGRVPEPARPPVDTGEPGLPTVTVTMPSALREPA